MQVYAVRYPAPFKTLANLLDPCYVGGSKSDTVTITGKPDTVTTAGAIIYVKGEAGAPDTVKLPGKITTIKIPVTIMIHDTVTDNRALEASRGQLKTKADSLIVVNTKNKAVTHSKSIWMLIAIGCMLAIVVFTAIKVYAFFSGGAITKLL